MIDIVVNRMAGCSSLLLRNSASLFSPELDYLTRHLYCLNTKVKKHVAIQKCYKKTMCNVTFLNSNNVKNYQIRPMISQQKSVSFSDNAQNKTEESKPSLFQRLKQMTKDYWYIVIPVHIVTSIGWGTTFYLCSKSGIDFVHLMETLHFSEKYVDMIKNSNAGHWVIAYTMYKLFTPARYTVTLGGTTMAIRYLNKWGYLKLKNPKQAIQSKSLAVKRKIEEKLEQTKNSMKT